MATPEGKVKALVKTHLRKLGAYWFMPVQNGMGSPALDFFVCYRGRFYAIETKAPGKKPTARQKNTAAAIEAAGGKAFVVDGEETLGLAIATMWLNENGLS